MIQLHDKQFVPFISAKEIDFAITKMVTQITADFSSETPVFIGVLNGAFMVVSDLLKRYTSPCEVSFIKMASYEGTSSTENVKQLLGLNLDLSGRTVIVIEDIVDTGNTLTKFLPQLRNQQPASLSIAALLQKPEALEHPLEVHYVGFSVPNKFLLGFGLDYDGQGRNLAEIYQLVED